jgi:hypothetical protein
MISIIVCHNLFQGQIKTGAITFSNAVQPGVISIATAFMPLDRLMSGTGFSPN